jgi:hypothetical protein
MTRRRAVVWPLGGGLAALSFALARGDHRAFSYAAVGAVLVLGIVLADRTAHYRPALLAALGWGASAHLAGGLLPGGQPDADILYDRWLVVGVVKFDQLVHFGCSVVLALAVHELLRAWMRPGGGTVGPAVIAGLGAVGLGGFNEAFEYLASLGGAGAFVGGYDNTGWDLVFDVAGAATGALWLALSPRSPRSPLGVAKVDDVADGQLAAQAIAGLDDEVAARRDVDRDPDHVLGP